MVKLVGTNKKGNGIQEIVILDEKNHLTKFGALLLICELIADSAIVYTAVSLWRQFKK